MANAHVLNPADVAARTLRGAIALGGGQVSAQLLNIAGAILLARALTPAEFGLVAILMFFLALLTALGDLGLGMSLVRRPAEPTDLEYRAVATFQLGVTLSVVVTAWLATPFVVRAYGLAADGWWLLPAMTVAILADAVRFLPLARLERVLQYERIGLVEVTQAVVFNAVLLTLAWSGWRAGCFPVAVVARSLAGAALASALGPRLRGWAWSWPIAREHLAFGLPFRGVHLLTVLRTSIVPTFVGLLIGRAAVGHLEWAAMVAGFPLTGLIILQRLYVGSFARLQHHPRELGAFASHLVMVAHALVAPVAVLTLVLVEPIVRIVFGAQWVGAIPLVYCLWLGCLVVPTLAPLAGLLHALGHSRTVFRAALFGTTITWIAGVPLVLWMGELGMALAGLAVHGANLVIWRRARAAADVRVMPAVAGIWACGALAGLAAWWWHAARPIATLADLLFCGAAAALVYGAAIVGLGLALFPAARRALAVDALRRPLASLRGSGQGT
jgi:O-antigen/teichoic acid export membrane protein